MERIPQEILQQVINEVVNKEGLWSSLILRRVNRSWDRTVLRAICIEGVLDPLSNYGCSDTSLQRPLENSYHRCFPHMLQRPPHWHIVPILETLALSSTRYVLNAASLAIRRAVDWIEQNFQKEFPNRSCNTRMLSEIIVIIDKDLWLWSLFKRVGYKPTETCEKDGEMDLRRSADLIMGLAVYTGDIQLYRSIRERIPNYQDAIVATTMVAAYRGNEEILKEMLDIAKQAKTKFPHLGKTSTGYLRAPHWCEIFKSSITYNVNSIHGGISIIRQLAIAGHAEVLRRAIGYQPWWKHLTFAIQEAMCLTQDLDTLKVLWDALSEIPDDRLIKLVAMQRAAFVAVVFGGTEIVAYLLSQGLKPEEPIAHAVDTLTGGVMRSPAKESIMMTAVKYGRKDVVKLLLDHGVHPDTSARSIGQTSESAVALAVKAGRTDIQELFSQYGYCLHSA
ncbi:hypothetical protein TWF106_011196 [Orbilia oligospora]|uniref:Uncharacterized protein n=1 Tax=Orbilia oligospora TaxID=2813651 RepID=A0A7C8UUT5_ORBOL|nr:hypothetical protein TWF106_011196 [Orbilia oligospora]KAF3229504.1 hypothetical protein TWF191_001226 [Orbilia oligospora]